MTVLAGLTALLSGNAGQLPCGHTFLNYSCWLELLKLLELLSFLLGCFGPATLEAPVRLLLWLISDNRLWVGFFPGLLFIQVLGYLTHAFVSAFLDLAV